MPRTGAEDRDTLNLKQVARVLGVHYMTAYRYVRSGRLPAHRDGNVWLVAAADLAALDRTDSAAPSSQDHAVDWAARMRERLIIGDEAGAWSVAESALVAGTDPSRVITDVIEEGVSLIHESDGPAAGHLAATTGQRISAQVAARFRRPGRSRGTVILGTPTGEAHGFATALAGDLLRLRNVGVLDLGVSASAPAFCRAAADADRLRAVAIGLTSVAHLDATTTVIRTLRHQHPDTPVLLGGQAVGNEEVAAAAGATCWAPDLAGVIELIEQQLPMPRSQRAVSR